MPRTSERGGPQTRARVGAVAARLFLERGYDAVTVAEIAREAGVSSVTVFNHFPRKEDLFLDRAADAVELLHAAVHDRGPGVDILTSLHDTVLILADTGHPLSGLNERSLGFFETVGGSTALVGRAREIGADLQQVLGDEIERDPSFDGDGTLLAAFFMAGYTTVLVETARRRVAGDPAKAVDADHRARLERLFEALRSGVATHP